MQENDPNYMVLPLTQNLQIVAWCGCRTRHLIYIMMDLSATPLARAAATAVAGETRLV